VALPKNVHRVVARGREYFYFQIGRGTVRQGPRNALPKDTHSPEFWNEIRRLQGIETGPVIVTVNAVCDLFLVWPPFRKLAAGTQVQYEHAMKTVRAAWGALPAAGLQPKHVQSLMDELADKPGKANNTLSFLRALNAWGRARGQFEHSITEGVTRYRTGGGHKPWTDEQQAAAEAKLTGAMRRGYFLARHTGQRGSDVIRLGETFIDDGGFRIMQKKTGAKTGEIWCPIEDALAAEMATWERAPGPYVRQADGSAYGKRTFEKHFAEVRATIPELAGVTFHGLRATRVIELRQRGATTLQIQDQVGMSVPMIERYCRFADKKANGKAAVVALAERRKRQMEG
jgi:integrase